VILARIARSWRVFTNKTLLDVLLLHSLLLDMSVLPSFHGDSLRPLNSATEVAHQIQMLILQLSFLIYCSDLI
jgi:hypothetical protein